MTIRDIEMEMLSKVLTNPKKCVMAELGNQRLKYKDYNGPAKKHFEKSGIEHHSFDINGLDGSNIVDLSKPIDSVWYNKFDIVTNAGTTEHITNGQIESFRNIHNMCKIMGFMIHSIPAIGSWKGHCPHRYSKDFIKKIAMCNKYEIIYDDYVKRNKKDYLICGVLRKTQEDFIVDESWLNEIETSKDYKINSDNKR